MVLNLLKAHPLNHIEGILAKSFAQFQLNQRAEVHQEHLESIETQLEPYGPRLCADWITQWQLFERAKKRKGHRGVKPFRGSPALVAQLPFLTPGRVVGLSKGLAIVLRQYHSRGENHPMLSVLRNQGSIAECPATNITQIFDHVLEFPSTRVFPWCSPSTLHHLTDELSQFPPRLRPLPILTDAQTKEDEQLTQVLSDEFPCPACPSRHACRKDHPLALRLRQKAQQLRKTVQALHTGLWHRFHERADVLQHFGYLTTNFQLTAEGDWARLIRIDHSLLITELIRMDAFSGIEPALLAGVLASIAHDDDRPGSYQRMSPGLNSMLHQVRVVANSLSAHEDPPLLRSDVAALTERWVGNPEVTWNTLIRTTNMAEGDVYRLLARTLEFLSQIHSLRVTHPGVADAAKAAITTMRREVLKELP